MCDHRERLASARAIPAEAGPNHRRFAPEGGVGFRRRGVERAAGPEEPSTKRARSWRRKSEENFADRCIIVRVPLSNGCG